MRARAAFRGLLAAGILAGAAVSCTSDRTPVAPKGIKPKLDEVATVTVTGRVLGPDGTSICNWASGVSLFFDFAGGGLSQVLRACPFDTYEATLAAGAHEVQVLVWSPNAPVPWWNYKTLTADPANPVQDFTLAAGTPLGGRATVDGNPVGGARINYAISPWYSINIDSSPVDGTWVYGGGPAYMQPGLPYYFGPCMALGTHVIPTSAPVAPAQTYSYDCAMKTSPAAGFTHTATPLWLTVGPADLGHSYEYAESEKTYGLGWGLQYPVAPGTTPLRSVFSTALRFGGLVISLPSSGLFAPASVFTVVGWTPDDVILPPGGRLAITNLAAEAKEIFWQYDDQGIAGAPGLAVAQKSWDGSGGSYVLIQYRIRNRSESPIDIAPGLFVSMAMLWRQDNAGAVAMNGRLIYQRLYGKFYGVLLLGALATPTARFVSFGNPPSAVVYGALRGQGGFTSFTGGFADMIAGTGVITLRPAHKTDLDVAIIGAQTLDELLASAAAADAEYATKAQ